MSQPARKENGIKMMANNRKSFRLGA